MLSNKRIRDVCFHPESCSPCASARRPDTNHLHSPRRYLTHPDSLPCPRPLLPTWVTESKLRARRPAWLERQATCRTQPTPGQLPPGTDRSQQAQDRIAPARDSSRAVRDRLELPRTVTARGQSPRQPAQRQLLRRRHSSAASAVKSDGASFTRKPRANHRRRWKPQWRNRRQKAPRCPCCCRHCRH